MVERVYGIYNVVALDAIRDNFCIEPKKLAPK